MHRTMRLLTLAAFVSVVGCATKPRAPQAPPPFVAAPQPVPGGLPPGAVAVPPGQQPFPTAPGGPAPTPFPTAPNNPPAGFAPQQQQAFPTAPPNGGIPQQPAFPSSPPTPPSTLPPPPPGPSGTLNPDPLLRGSSASSPIDQAGYAWKPATPQNPATKPTPSGPSLEGQVLLLPPEPAPKNGPTVRLYQDESNKNAANPINPKTAKDPPPSIPKFTTVRTNIESGLRPFNPEGFDWLAANGYKTVLYIRLKGTNDDAERKLADDRKLAFLSLEVSPFLLDRETIKEFFRMVQTSSNQPMYVYGQDECLTGGMWYLSFRLLDGDTDDVARVRAAALGLRPGEGTPNEMLQAVVKAASEQ